MNASETTQPLPSHWWQMVFVCARVCVFASQWIGYILYRFVFASHSLLNESSQDKQINAFLNSELTELAFLYFIFALAGLKSTECVLYKTRSSHGTVYVTVTVPVSIMMLYVTISAPNMHKCFCTLKKNEVLVGLYYFKRANSDRISSDFLQ